MFQKHIFSHQFRISMPRYYETILFGIKIFLDLHLVWIMMQVNVEKLLLVFLELLFFVSYKMLKDLWQTLSIFTMLFYDVHSSLYYWHGQHERGGHHYLIFFKHEVRWPHRRSFICLSPLLNTSKNHCASPQLCFSIPNGQYPHCGPYERNYFCIWPPFDPISLSWA
jgi:hypothetical protein